VDPALVTLMLAVANSTLALRFYDVVCGNRLYAGRRRFITQYVRRFPLPDPSSAASKRVIRLTEELLASRDTEDQGRVSELERKVDELVWRSFGFAEEVHR
jgi:hypothetical protein